MVDWVIITIVVMVLFVFLMFPMLFMLWTIIVIITKRRLIVALYPPMRTHRTAAA